MDDRTLRCFGDNQLGQLGLGRQSWRESPTPVPGLADVREVGVSSSHVCALTMGGEVYCWGNTDSGQAGPEARRIGLEEHPICELDVEATRKAVAELRKSLGCPPREVWDDHCGEEGPIPHLPQMPEVYVHTPTCLEPKANTNYFVSHPVRVAAASGAIALAVGGMTCALRRDGQLICWGALEPEPFRIAIPSAGARW
jgi:alpha-tubulin suppressor-like RCC1 family protein